MLSEPKEERYRVSRAMAIKLATRVKLPTRVWQTPTGRRVQVGLEPQPQGSYIIGKVEYLDGEWTWFNLID